VRVKVLQQREADDKDSEEEDAEDRIPPGAAASWTVDINEVDQTTSKPSDVVVVTSPVCTVNKT